MRPVFSLLAALLLCLSIPVQDVSAEEVVLGLSQDDVAISTRFEGSEILIFGAIKREAPIETEPPLQVVITVAGPNQVLTVRRKERRFGIWINTDTVEVDAAPSFYAVATSAPAMMKLAAGHHHILDPKNRMAPQSTVSVSAANAALADGLSTALCVTPDRKVRSVLSHFPDAKLEMLVP